MADSPLLRSELLERHGLIGLFTRRTGGVSPAPFDSFNFGKDIGDADHNIDQNLDILLKTAGLTALPHQARQVHGTDICNCSGTGYLHDACADILIASRPGTALGVRTADCLPLLLADSEAGIIAAVHAGWRGTAAAVAARAVDAMKQLGARPERMIATLGPCIGNCCFVIGEEAAEQLADCCEDAATCIRHSSEIRADIRELNRLQLKQSGLNPENIESFDECTVCHPERYYSYRRNGRNSGRHLAVVALPSRP
ncbi:hypothetical protein Ga0123462_0726 [Mariprofundus ferrinatatus]|uniref:Purine nucleoside phosphorylase n=1 Tax=Mariprofundus ferrinatatus TaxID=1921087 RepID=A0A2K8LBH4_9PROT|nr:peptidoglycan editing factor PgeF [Mariprofundus ferrinatatus]ATX81596.1 hypothetical protein Ga0123462_0726 [Mariprofundus ferrinatatus]